MSIEKKRGARDLEWQKKISEKKGSLSERFEEIQKNISEKGIGTGKKRQ